MQEWKRPDLSENRPAPLVIEVYIDTSSLNPTQALVVHDEAGSRWDVCDALGSSANSSPRPTKNGNRLCEVVLERWTVSLSDTNNYTAAELDDLLPNVYKKGVVLFRSLYTLLRLLPAWKLHRRLARQPGGQQALKVKYRIRQEQGLARGQKDALLTPLCPSDSTTTRTRSSENVIGGHHFQPLVTPAGGLHIACTYRSTTLDFRVADAESLLSSRFLDFDLPRPSAIMTGRSLPSGRQPAQPYPPPSPSPRTQPQYASPIASRSSTTKPKLLNTYGSLGSNRTLAQAPTQSHDDNKSPRDILSNPPFKSGSMASNTAPRQILPQVGSEKSVPESFKRQSRPASPLAPQPSAPQRFSSSFANRTKRPISASGSARTGGSGGSSGASVPLSDDDAVVDFVSLLQNAKLDEPIDRTRTISLARFQSMQQPSTALADEMSASSLINTGSTPPSRRLSNVPGLSTSSPPGLLTQRLRTSNSNQPPVRSRLSIQEEDSDDELCFFGRPAADSDA